MLILWNKLFFSQLQRATFFFLCLKIIFPISNGLEAISVDEPGVPGISNFYLKPHWSTEYDVKTGQFYNFWIAESNLATMK